MIKYIRIAVALFVLFLVLFSWSGLRDFFLKDDCLDAGGKWANNGNYCIPRDCAKYNNCKASYNNMIICKQLNLGIDKNELFFKLGIQESINGNIYTFSGGSDEPKIRASIINGVVDKLYCGN